MILDLKVTNNNNNYRTLNKFVFLQFQIAQIQIKQNTAFSVQVLVPELLPPTPTKTTIILHRITVTQNLFQKKIQNDKPGSAAQINKHISESFNITIFFSEVFDRFRSFRIFRTFQNDTKTIQNAKLLTSKLLVSKGCKHSSNKIQFLNRVQTFFLHSFNVRCVSKIFSKR
eukprot:TRINITY_DN17966_c0_g1_i5.p1 TRINITY_DN17966_c0_g1~~TRINITY_DN17966_c0_g1_i5.p1  ORF type:complete len:171 (-),score=0.30 TRINITY_DN17966_c0_g1_i5:227-739(-)